VFIYISYMYRTWVHPPNEKLPSEGMCTSKIKTQTEILVCICGMYISTCINIYPVCIVRGCTPPTRIGRVCWSCLVRTQKVYSQITSIRIQTYTSSSYAFVGYTYIYIYHIYYVSHVRATPKREETELVGLPGSAV